MKLFPSLLLGISLLVPFLARAQVSFGSSSLINDGWLFALRDQDVPRQYPELGDVAWTRVDLPHDWSVRQPLNQNLASATGYLPGGIGWYVKSLQIPTQPNGEKVFLYFEGVYNHSEVYLNGQLLGKRPNGYVSFVYDATPHVKFDQANVLAVRVDHHFAADSRWYTGSGIYRNVYVIRAGRVHVAPWGVFVRAAAVDRQHAKVRIETEIVNETDHDAALRVRQEILAADGALVGQTESDVAVPKSGVAKPAVNVDVPVPHLWSIADPYLYTVRTTVLHDGRQIEQTLTRTGLRTMQFAPNEGFSLNGENLKLKGVCVHHDAGVLGAAVPRSVWRYRLQQLKQLGTNAIRLSHNPQAPDIYELCDELGLLVMDEAFDEWEYPKRKWLSGWNVGTPGYEGSAAFFEEWRDRDIAAMVRRDRNHASVFAWSIGNEIDYPNDPYSHPVLDRARINQPTLPGYKSAQPHAARLGPIAAHLAAEVKKHDPSRPVTAALAGVIMSNETDYPGALDLVGYNYTEDRYAEDHAKYPQRIIYGSENGHSFSAWKAVRDHDYISGQFLWTGIDYLGEAGAWPSRGSSAGLLDLTGAVKPRGHFRQALWSQTPIIYLGTDASPRGERNSLDAVPRWNFAPGTPVRVLCYTNAAKARLLLDGQQIADDKSPSEADGIIAWDVPYKPGKLEVMGFDQQGNETCRTFLQTAGDAARMKLTLEIDGAVGQEGVSMVSLQLVDAQDRPVLTGDREVTCTVDDPARLLGLEAGDLKDVSDYTSSTRRVYHGRVVAYVQATTRGNVRIRFSTDQLPDAILDVASR